MIEYPLLALYERYFSSQAALKNAKFRSSSEVSDDDGYKTDVRMEIDSDQA